MRRIGKMTNDGIYVFAWFGYHLAVREDTNQHITSSGNSRIENPIDIISEI